MAVHFEGDSSYDPDVGCRGCGWAYPEQFEEFVATVLGAQTVRPAQGPLPSP
jgi:hypothetical protein